MSTPEANKALAKAKIHLMSKPDTTFFSVVCCNLSHEWSDTVPTAATDGTKILYNPDFFMRCNPAQQVGLLLHEVLHVVFTHMLRLGERNPQKFNRAADYAINIIIDKAGFKLPDGALLDYQYDGMSAEQIYELLDDDETKDPNGPLPMEDLIGAPDSGVAGQIQERVDDIVVQAAQASAAAGDKAGSIPGDVERYLEKLTNPVVPWDRLLRAFMSKLAKVEYSFTRPNRRFFTQDILMPSMSGEKLCKGAVAVDVSGSVCEKQFNEFVSETAAIIKSQEPEYLNFLQFDTKITQDDTIETVQDLKKLKFTGCGGTLIEPVMEWAEEHKPNWLIVFTDGYYRPPELNPKVPVIWVIYDNPDFKAPFGRTIHYTFKD